ncbi:MAG TPA: phosphotransferase [Gaiellaceae bacterium]|nr:phosphotransferase [Gaiellaceae bacterium]
MKPEAVASTEQVMGAAAAAWTPVASRYALGDRWLIRLDDGRTAFAKRAIGEPTAAWLRQEHDLYVALGASFMPGLLGWKDGSLPLLVLEDLSAATWPPPWAPGSVEAVLRTLEDVAATPPPAGLRRITDDPPAGWRDVARDRAPFLRLGVCSDAWLDEALPTLLHASDPSLLEGDGLLHLDVRSDNLCIRDGQAVLVDWNWASVGNPAVDIAFWLPSLTLEGGLEPDEIARFHPGAETLAAVVAGFFAANAGLPPPSGAPAVRAFQLAQLEVALPWTVRTLGLPAL